jgi:dipeptidase E
LRWILQDTGADEIIKELVSKGTVYGGGSAGAIVAGPTLKHFEDADNPSDSPELILEGLNLTNIVVVPHADNAKYGKAMKKINTLLKKDGYSTITITDQEGVLIDANKQKIVP